MSAKRNATSCPSSYPCAWLRTGVDPDSPEQKGVVATADHGGAGGEGGREPDVI